MSFLRRSSQPFRAPPGFTLIELLAVIAVIGILTSILIPTIGGGMATWREKLFAQMHHNASSAAEFFNLPSNSVVELGSKIEI